MEHIGGSLEKIGQNMRLNTADPIARDGFTQLPNFILSSGYAHSAKVELRSHGEG
jgi:hypothetical protein